MNEFEDLKILAQDLKAHDILIIDGGKYKSEVFMATPISTPGWTIISVLAKGMEGGADEFKFKFDTLIDITRRKPI